MNPLRLRNTIDLSSSDANTSSNNINNNESINTVNHEPISAASGIYKTENLNNLPLQSVTGSSNCSIQSSNNTVAESIKSENLPQNLVQIIRTNINAVPTTPLNYSHIPIESANLNSLPQKFKHIPAAEPVNFNRLRIEPVKVNLNSVQIKSVPNDNSNLVVIKPNYRPMEIDLYGGSIPTNINNNKLNSSKNRILPITTVLPNNMKRRGSSSSVTGNLTNNNFNNKLVAVNLNAESVSVNYNVVMLPPSNNRIDPVNVNSRATAPINMNTDVILDTRNWNGESSRSVVTANLNNGSVINNIKINSETKVNIDNSGKPVGPTMINKNSGPTVSCRMSWFLVKLENTETYTIIHSADILEDYTDIYLNRKIKFNRDRCTLYGRVISGSDDISYVEKQLNMLKSKIKDLSLPAPIARTSPDQWYLIQYSNKTNNIAFSVVNLNNVTLIHDNNNNIDNNNNKLQEVYINEGDKKISAKILYGATNENLVLDQFMALKSKIIDTIIKTKTDKADNDGVLEPWILVQYSNGVNNAIYSTFSLTDTIWKDENYYKNNIAYVEEDQTVYHAIILKRSSIYLDISKELNNIKENSLTFVYPIKLDNIECNDEYSLGTCRIIKNFGLIDVEYIRQMLPRTSAYLVDEYRKRKMKRQEYLRKYVYYENYKNDDEIDRKLKYLEALEKQMYKEKDEVNAFFRAVEKKRKEVTEKLAHYNNFLLRN